MTQRFEACMAYGILYFVYCMVNAKLDDMPSKKREKERVQW